MSRILLSAGSVGGECSGDQAVPKSISVMLGTGDEAEKGEDKSREEGLMSRWMMPWVCR